MKRGPSYTELNFEGKGSGIPEGWFIGPKAENEALLRDLIVEAIEKNVEYRRKFHPEDPVFITEKVKRTTGYKHSVANLRRHSGELFDALQKSAPIFSMRHQGHMLWEQALPAIIGYFGAMLYNQNNVAAEASPVTTWLEIVVGNDLCEMLGYPVPKKITAPKSGTVVPWGHITCGGSVANMEALWAARNVKLHPVALRAALREVPAFWRAKKLEVKVNGRMARLIDLDVWTLLNLMIDDVISLPQVMEDQFEISVEASTQALLPYSVQNVGLIEFYKRHMDGISSSPVALVPATRHYSWPKAGALLGLGQNNILTLDVDHQARMDVDHLVDRLQICLQKHVPVLSVIAVIGSTEESAVDPLCRILEVRKAFQEQGLNFAIHCDAAWGGYFNTMLRGDSRRLDIGEETPTFHMSDYVRDQYRALCKADSITVDPHKAGYVPYPAGGLCYRNSGMRDFISLKAPVIFHNQTEPTVGIYGIEGSKPGAAAASVYLAHRVIRPDRSGYGRILGQCMWTSKRMYARLVAMQDARFTITFLQELPSERGHGDPKDVTRQKNYIRDHFVHCTNRELRHLLDHDKEAKKLFTDIGSDQVILSYSFNFVNKSGKLNSELAELNELNDEIFRLCSISVPPKSIDDLNKTKLILTSSSFDPAKYGQPFVDRYARRLGLKPVANVPINFLISTTMDPWTTNTTTVDFLYVIEKALRGAVHEALDNLGH